MSTVNTATLLTKLTTLATRNYADGSTVVDDVLATSISVDLLNETNRLTVASVELLPNLQYFNAPSGMVYFITSLEIFAVSSGSKWLTLDGRLLRQDIAYGTTWAWGCNNCGQLGDSTIVSKSSPVSVVGIFTDWCQISAGFTHSLGVRANGTVWAWGNNSLGRLGDGTITTRVSPVSVVGGFTDWCQVSANNSHNLGVRTDGTAWAWGSNTSGRLGDGTTAASQLSPVSVVGGFTDWWQVSAGGSHSLGLRTDGTAWAWGLNCDGRLGDGTIVDKSSPVSVIGGFTDWCQVSAGFAHSLGLRTSGSLWAWGCNASGQLGNGTITSQRSPVSVIGGFTDWCQVSAGNAHSAAVRTNGTAWAWGFNGSGQLADNTLASKSSPVSVIGGFTDWCQVSSGAAHTLGIRTNGSLWSWGNNTCGQLGDGTITNRSSPVSVLGGFTDWCQVSANSCHSLGIRST